MVFAWSGAEELGLLGSRWLVRHRPPRVTVPVAMVNLDMVGRLRGCRLYVESRGSARSLPALVDAANAGFGFDARPWERTRGHWGLSDPMSFTAARVPAVSLFTGLHDDYHRPSDDPPTLNHRGLAAVAAFAARVTRAIADGADHDPAGFAFTR